MRLMHNMFSLSIYKTYKSRLEENPKTVKNASTGIKLNSAKDNPGRIGKNETLKIQVLTNDAAAKDIQDTNSMIQTFDSALQEINNSLNRMRELTVSAGSGMVTDEDKKVIQNEIDSIKAEIDSFASNTEFNGIKLSDSSLTGEATSSIKATIGTMDDESMSIPRFNVSAQNIGLGNVNINNIDTSLDSIDKATQMISRVRSKYGSIQIRLEGTADYLSSKDISVQTAQSRIGDADVAEEAMNYSKSQLLVNSSIGLMAQSNNFPKDVLNILANVK